MGTPTSLSDNDARRRVVLVTGPSGAGRSTAINALEDFGFEAIDNLPLSLMPLLLRGAPVERPLALGIDARNRDFDTRSLIETVDELARDPSLEATLLYLDSRADVLVRRFSETRRRHPVGGASSLEGNISAEIDLLAPLRVRADILIDTSEMTPHELKAELRRWFEGQGSGLLALSVQSFSYKRGLPTGVDMVLDCRFLRNPHWSEALRPRDGRDPEVQAHIAADPLYAPFLEQVDRLVKLLIPAFVEEGKAHFTLAFGCTGGRHRSVALSEEMAKSLARSGWRVSIRHRELERGGDARNTGWVQA